MTTATCHSFGWLKAIERRPPLRRTHFTRFAHGLKATLERERLTGLARRLGQCRRLRDVTPQRLVCSLLEALGSRRVETVADIQRAFNAQTGLDTRYKAFYNQLAKPAFPRFMRAVFQELLANLSQNVLRPMAGTALSAFEDVVIQDGSSFAVHDALARTFGGRFTKIRPAAVEVHTFLSVYRDQVLRVQVAADKEAEAQFLPPPAALRGKLWLADRGYESLDYWERVDRRGGFFIVRGKKTLNPHVIRVRGLGRSLRRFEGQRLHDILPRLPRRCLDLVVEFRVLRDRPLRLRMVLLWAPTRRCFLILITNVPRRRMAARQVLGVYRLRWQVELVFKEWKSYANLHAFVSRSPTLVEGLIWASLCAAALKRSVAHACQRVGNAVPISTRIVAMCGAFILPDLLRCALRAFRRLDAVVTKVFRYLWENAARAHPQRDRLRGRLKWGLQCVGVTA